MAYDVTQWLTEIRTLQRQLADALKERDQAYNSAANWRRLYETEARQRRQAVGSSSLPEPELVPELASEASQPIWPAQPPATDLPADQATLLQQLEDRCQALEQLLEAEKLAHARTRHTLTTALGETFETLKPDLALVHLRQAAQDQQ